jgi:hypothetical protein
MGGEMVLPFFHLENWIEVNSLNAYDEMGRLDLTDLTLLRHANGGTEEVNITIFAWAENVRLCIPTTELSAQGKKSFKIGGKDEYQKKGAISSIASTIATAAGALEAIPAIAPFAMATRIGAGAIAGMARAFGFSRPAVLTTAAYMKPQYSTSLANTDSDETVLKLTLDSKQEITIDPRTVGLGSTDEMSIKSIACKEGLYRKFTWTNANDKDDLLFATHVNPLLCTPFASTYGDSVLPTPICYATLPFQYWSGTIKFRFMIVKSGFHSGRLLFTYEPIGNSNAGNSSVMNTVYNQVIDIREIDDFEMEVAWTRQVPYLPTNKVINLPTSTISAAAPITLDAFSNGIITVTVLNDLRSPTNLGPVDILVFVSAGDDFELTTPTDYQLKQFSMLESQSGLIAQSGVEAECDMYDPLQSNNQLSFVGTADVSSAEQKPTIFFGEKVVSFRALLKRYNHYRNWAYDQQAGVNLNYVSMTLTEGFKPYTRGHGANSPDVSTLGTYSYVNDILLNYLMPAYVGYRGGLRKKYTFLNHTGVHHVWYRRETDAAMAVGVNYRSVSNGGDTISLAVRRGMGEETGLGGGIIQPLTNSPYLEVEVPFYTGKRFAFARTMGKDNTRDMTSTLKTVLELTHIQPTATPPYGIIREYLATAEDFALFYFVSAPPLYYNGIPTPA